MKLLKTVTAGLFLSAMAAAPAFAQSGDNEITYISPSIIMIGTPDPCDNGACEEDVASVESQGDSNSALVDAYGMPTSMPVIMRPSVEITTAAAAVAPAIVPAPAATPAEAAAATPAPAPVAQAPANPAPRQEGQLN